MGSGCVVVVLEVRDEYWDAVAGMAEGWRASRTVQAVTAALPTDDFAATDPIGELLADVRAVGVATQPL